MIGGVVHGRQVGYPNDLVHGENSEVTVGHCDSIGYRGRTEVHIEGEGRV